MLIAEEAVEVAQKVKSCGMYSVLVIEEIARISQKILDQEPLNYLEVSLLEIVRESLEFGCLSSEGQLSS
jgi:hypothetical protein